MLNYREALTDLFEGPAEPQYGRQWDKEKPTIAVVLDEFSTQCFRGVANIVPIGVHDIGKALDYFQPDLLMCESAWRGNDFAWRYRFARTNGVDPKVEELVAAARSRGIPSVFWNKEDPPHFDEFKDTAALFDHIFTTEASVVPRYREITGRDNVHVLPFAAAPDIHSPRRVESYRRGEVAFAGQYFVHKFPERRAQMDYLFPAASEFRFDIFSRELNGDPNYRFPEKYEEKIKGSLPYDQMVLAYRQYKIFLNVNSVPQSESMCARRIFELSACKTLVLSSPSSAISRFYGRGEVLQAGSREEAEACLDSAVNDETYFERTAHQAWRVTMRRHTYADRLKYILSIVSAPTESGERISELPAYDDEGPLPFDYVAYLDVSAEDDARELLGQIASQSVLPNCVVVSEEGAAGTPVTSAEDLVEAAGFSVAKPHEVSDVFAVSFAPSMAYGPTYAEDLYLSARQQPERFIGKTELFDGTVIPGRPMEEATPELFRGTIASRSLADMIALYEVTPADAAVLNLPTPGYSADRFNCVRCDSPALRNEEWKI